MKKARSIKRIFFVAHAVGPTEYEQLIVIRVTIICLSLAIATNNQ
jgi:hypothetical protein